MPLIRALLALLLAGSVGFTLARAASGRTRAGVPVARPSPSSLRCVQVHEDGRSCPGVDAELDVCQRSLSALEAVRPSTRLAPPELPEDQQAGPWTEALERALVECRIPAALVVTDCDEAPCAAALRGGEEVAAAWAACPALVERKIDVALQDVHCPDGTVEHAWVAASTDMDLWRSVIGVGGAAVVNPTLSMFIAYGRRTESTLQMWDCNVDHD